LFDDFVTAKFFREIMAVVSKSVFFVSKLRRGSWQP